MSVQPRFKLESAENFIEGDKKNMLISSGAQMKSIASLIEPSRLSNYAASWPSPKGQNLAGVAALAKVGG